MTINTVMNTRILLTRPGRLTLCDFMILRGSPVLRDAYKHRWTVAFY